MEETNSNSQSPENPEEQTAAEQPQPAAEPAPPVVEPAPAEEVSRDARNMAMLCHLLAIFGFLAPLIIWLLKKEDDPFIDKQGKEALNFQITVILAATVATVLSAFCIGVPLLAAILILNFIFCLIAAVKVSGGQDYRYPVALRLVK